MAGRRERGAGWESDAGGSTAAVVSSRLPDARSALRLAAGAFAAATLRGIAMTVPSYLARLRSRGSLPLVLAGSGADMEEDRRFFEDASARLVIPPPAADVYDAIAGLRTDLPPRPSSRRREEGGEPYLLLEGDVDSARATRALESAVRSWIVEDAGSIRLSMRALARLRKAGVRWSALRPVRLLAVVDPLGASRGLFPRTPRWGVRGPASARPAGPRRRPARR